MNTSKNVIITLIIIAIAIVGILLIVSLTGGTGDEAPNATTTDDVADDDTNRIITARHQFEDGTHIVAGEVNLPTPCDLLETDAALGNGTSTEQVTIEFTTTSEAEQCAQVITPQRFKVEFQASEDADIDATFNGNEVTLNLIEVGPDENLEDFEVFIKG